MSSYDQSVFKSGGPRKTIGETVPTRRSTGATGDIEKGREGNVFISHIPLHCILLAQLS